MVCVLWLISDWFDLGLVCVTSCLVLFVSLLVWFDSYWFGYWSGFCVLLRVLTSFWVVVR